MFKDSRVLGLAACLLALSAGTAFAASETAAKTERLFNPYHEQQLQEQIQKCASGVLACTDEETRCLKQQELCGLLIRSERYDQALQVANNIYNTQKANDERRAAHHVLMAEIYINKMKGSRTVEDMEKNRQFALSIAQEVVDKKYPAKWGVSEHARSLIRDMNDSRAMGSIRQRVAAREGKGDLSKEAIAEAQRKYLDQTQGNGGSSRRAPQQFTRVEPEAQPVAIQAPVAEKSVVSLSGKSASQSLSAQPEVSQVFTPLNNQAGSSDVVGSRLQQSGLLTSQAGGSPSGKSVGGGLLTVNGQPANNLSTPEDIAKHNLAQLLEAKRKRQEETRRSPYATGEMPVSSR